MALLSERGEVKDSDEVATGVVTTSAVEAVLSGIAGTDAETGDSSAVGSTDVVKSKVDGTWGTFCAGPANTGEGFIANHSC